MLLRPLRRLRLHSGRWSFAERRSERPSPTHAVCHLSRGATAYCLETSGCQTSRLSGIRVIRSQSLRSRALWFMNARCSNNTECRWCRGACRGTHVGLLLGCQGELKVAAEVKKTWNNHNVMVKQSEGMFSTRTKAIIQLTSEAFLRYHHFDMRKAAAVPLMYYASSHLPLPKARSYRMRVWIARMHYSSSSGICSEPHQPPASWIAWQSSRQ